jgi:aromatic-L-amino-acid/L-tryptophan decarboxylase
MEQVHPGEDAGPSRRALSFDDAELARAGALLADLLRRFEASLQQRPVMPKMDREQLSELLSEPFPKTGTDVASLFSDIEARLLPNCTTTPHPRFLAYVLGAPNGFAPFAEAVAAVINQNCNFCQLSPAASVIERRVITWLASLFAYPESAGGILTSGGSMATLMASLYSPVPVPTFAELAFLN